LTESNKTSLEFRRYLRMLEHSLLPTDRSEPSVLDAYAAHGMTEPAPPSPEPRRGSRRPMSGRPLPAKVDRHQCRTM